MSRMFTTALGLCAAILGWIALPTSTMAAPCMVSLASTNPDGTLTSATSCGFATPANNSPASTQAALNAANPGGLGLTWTFIDRDPGSNGGDIEAAFAMTGQTSGTWSIDATVLNAGYNTFIITMKDGAPLQDSFLWFLVDTSANACSPAAARTYCGTWSMYGTNGDPKNVSDLNLFAAVGPTQLPVPGTVSLLGIALGGIGLFSRRRRA